MTEINNIDNKVNMHNLNVIMKNGFDNLKNHMIDIINRYQISTNSRLDKFENEIKNLKKINLNIENTTSNNKKHNDKKYLSKSQDNNLTYKNNISLEVDNINNNRNDNLSINNSINENMSSENDDYENSNGPYKNLFNDDDNNENSSYDIIEINNNNNNNQHNLDLNKKRHWKKYKKETKKKRGKYNY